MCVYSYHLFLPNLQPLFNDLDNMEALLVILVLFLASFGVNAISTFDRLEFDEQLAVPEANLSVLLSFSGVEKGYQVREDTKEAKLRDRKLIFDIIRFTNRYRAAKLLLFNLLDDNIKHDFNLYFHNERSYS